MTPIEYGLTAFLITLGIVAPIIITLIVWSVNRGVRELLEDRKDKYRRYMNPEYWHVRKVEQAPNPDYIQVHMENSASRELICHGIEKKHLRSLKL
jgi:hypothetical protein